ncbi:hypothetical protein ZIOFF_043023 [Zingiber officinale]|uniref:Coenzyme Q-binding protein COQ10 START domain-containing protein n=1 Tax=Zingiber officinale TaxID=94328 RepID=A0A8J5G3D5_ZINOF|nr:hypothetical protein ZIOFF_043023 [Zingiber officinale]
MKASALSHPPVTVRRLHSPYLSAGRSPGILCSHPPSSLPDCRAFFSRSLDGADPGPKNQPHKGKKKEQGARRGERSGGGGGGGTEEVHCEVDVVSWRERRVQAWILVNADVESVWSVLTDYERLADFIPNLIYSERIPCPHKGRIWLEQRGLQRALYWHIEARVVLDLQEFPNSLHLALLNSKSISGLPISSCRANGSELHFSMVDGDFNKFEGKWTVKAGPRSSMATLSYEVTVVPRFNFPTIFLERIIRSDLPVNLRAIAWRAERIFEEIQKEIISTNGMNTTLSDLYSSSLGRFGSASKTQRLPNSLKKPVKPLGSVLSSPSTEPSAKWGVYGNACRLDRQCMVDEIHLRRIDGLLENGGAHRCVMASVTIKAPVQEVWSVLTAYETLPEIVPNLAISKILYRDKNKVRILQEGCKGLLYMVLHARVILDLCEDYEHKIKFEQVEGDFDSFRGNWILEQLGDQHTLLKYIVESRMHKDTFLSEAILEEVIYEDLPSNLCSIRDFVEKKVSVNSEQENHSDDHVDPDDSSLYASEGALDQPALNGNSLHGVRQRPKVPGLQGDIEILKTELTAFILRYGQAGFMPMRKQLRMHRRVDIEKAITRMGGFRRIADLMNLSLAYKHRKPRGYWDNLENLQEEISRFQKNWGMDPAYMPSRRSLERAGRYDITRALEKWGGLQEVSRLLSLELRYPRRRSVVVEQDEQNNISASRELTTQEKRSSKPLIAQDTQKWLMKLKDLDINWVE